MKLVKIQDDQTVQLLDITYPKNLVNLTKVAERADYCQSYVQQLVDPNNERKRPQALKKVRNAIIALYGSAVKVYSEATV